MPKPNLNETQVVFCPRCGCPKFFDILMELPDKTSCVNAGLKRDIGGAFMPECGVVFNPIQPTTEQLENLHHVYRVRN